MVDAPITATASDTEPTASAGPAARTVVATRYEIARVAELCALLREWPPVFPTEIGAPIRPLALGIHDALKALTRPETDDAQLKQALRGYCLGLGYLLAQGRPGAWRYDLAGHPVEPVSEEHRRTAWTRFKTVRAHRERIRAARRTAQPPQEATTTALSDAAPCRRRVNALGVDSARSRETPAGLTSVPRAISCASHGSAITVPTLARPPGRGVTGAPRGTGPQSPVVVRLPAATPCGVANASGTWGEEAAV